MYKQMNKENSCTVPSYVYHIQQGNVSIATIIMDTHHCIGMNNPP